MQWKNLFKPTKTTWILFGIIILILVLNVIILNTFNFGIESLVMIPLFLPLSIFSSIGLKVTSGGSWFPLPNTLGYVLIIVFNVIIIYFLALIITFIATTFKNNIKKS